MLDLRREDIHPAHDQHVIGTAEDAREAHGRAPAGAGLALEPRAVARAVAKERKGLLGRGGEHELAHLAIRHGLVAVWIQDFGDEVVLPEVHALAVAAAGRHARPDDFREPELLVDGDAHPLLDLATEAVGHRFGADAGGTEGERAQVDALGGGDLGDVDGVGGSGREGRHPEVAEQHDLPRGVAGGRGYHRRAEARRGLVKAEAAGEEPVAERVLEHVARSNPGRDQPAGDEARPQLEIRARVPDHRRLARRPGRCVDTHDLGRRRHEEAEGIVPPDVVLGGEGKAAEVVERVEVLRVDRSEPFAIEGVARALEPLDAGAEALDLQGRELAPRHRLRRVPEPLSARHRLGPPFVPATHGARLDALRRRARSPSHGPAPRGSARTAGRKPGSTDASPT